MSSQLAVSQQIKVAPLVLGTNVFGWTADVEVCHRILDGYVEMGGNFIDTADSYSFWAEGNSGGEAETIIGSWLAQRDDRDKILVASKVSHHPQLSGMAPATINAAIDGSLTRLGLDYLDIYYAHFDDPSTPLVESIEAMSGLVDQGKIRSIGISNYSPERIAQWLEISEREGFPPPSRGPRTPLQSHGTRRRGIAPTAGAKTLPRRLSVLFARARIPDREISWHGRGRQRSGRRRRPVFDGSWRKCS